MDASGEIVPSRIVICAHAQVSRCDPPSLLKPLPIPETSLQRAFVMDPCEVVSPCIDAKAYLTVVMLARDNRLSKILVIDQSQPTHSVLGFFPCMY